jgi:hypothetical protein
MANVSPLGNQIFINQNMHIASTKIANHLSRLTAQDVVNSESYEENCKRLTDTRDPEKVNEIDENLIEDAVYSVKKKYKRQDGEKEDDDEVEKEKKHLIDEKRKKIDITI